MKLKRFDNMNEAAKKSEKVELEKNALSYILDELKKIKLCRAEIIKKIETKFKDDKDVSKVARSIADDISTKKDIKSESYMKSMGNKKDTYNTAFYFIGTDAKEPTGATKKVAKEKDETSSTKKDKKGKKISNFKDFKGKDKKEDKKDKEEVTSSDDKPKFGSAEWREMYSKKKKK